MVADGSQKAIRVVSSQQLQIALLTNALAKMLQLLGRYGTYQHFVRRLQPDILLEKWFSDVDDESPQNLFFCRKQVHDSTFVIDYHLLRGKT